MPITRLPLADLVSADCPAESSRRRMLTDVNVRIAKAKKVVVVSGAGISCSSGIPVSHLCVHLYTKREMVFFIVYLYLALPRASAALNYATAHAK